MRLVKYAPSLMLLLLACATTAQAAGTPAPKSGPGRHGLKGEFKAGIEDILKATGLTKEQFAQGRKDGKSINQILRDNGHTDFIVDLDVPIEFAPLRAPRQNPDEAIDCLGDGRR